MFGLHDPGNLKPMRKRAALDCNDADLCRRLSERAACTHAAEEHQVIEGTTRCRGRTARRSL
eukprot:5283848-Lingulodinium_polyedra.AAC.1